MKTSKHFLQWLTVALLLTVNLTAVKAVDPSIPGDYSVCLTGISEPYRVTDVASSTFTWSILSGVSGTDWTLTSTSSNNNTIKVLWKTPGTYTLQVIETNSNSCSGGPMTIQVTVNALPTVTVNSPTVCAGTAATITATPGAVGTYNYVWTVPATVTDPGNVANFTSTVAGTYSVVITNTATTCSSASASGTVTVNPLPTVTVNSPTVCAGTAATITATPGAVGTYNYVWTVPPTVTDPGNVANFTSTVAGTYSVVITNTATTCFSASASGTVTVNPLPTVTVNSPTVCAGTSATITATPGAVGTYTYVWTVPATVTDPGNVASFTSTLAGTYSVVITNTATTCSSASASGTVTIYAPVNTSPIYHN
ncbi:MAG: hypothetical protein GZ091_05260 [Paludibacter sp.]|nr:hypothetical protein [Paludibacter sp.]